MFRLLNMKLLADRIKLILKEHPELEGDEGQAGLVKKSAASKSVVNQWLSGSIKSINIEYALAIEENLGYSHIWLMTGRDPVRATPQAGDPQEMQLLAYFRALPPADKRRTVTFARQLVETNEPTENSSAARQKTSRAEGAPLPPTLAQMAANLEGLADDPRPERRKIKGERRK
jgi:hypothetical protein